MSFKVTSPCAALRRRIQLRLILSLLPLLVLAGNGCRTAKKAVALPGNVVTTVVPGMKSPPPPDPAALQTEVLHYADSFAGQTSAALDEYARRVNTAEARRKALDWKLSLGSSALGIATGPNPTANLLDFVTLTTLLRASLEDQAPNAVPPGSLDGWLNATIILETNAWKLAERTLTTDQQAQLLVAIDHWRSENPTNSAAFLTRPQEVTTLIRQAGEKEGRSGSVFSWVGLDPMSGLDPAVREVTRTRLFAERALFAAQRTPTLLRWQIELMSDQLLRQQQVTNTVQSVDRLSRAAESISQTAALLPDRIADERKAILDALETQQGKLRDLSAQVGQTLSSGEKMSTSLNTTLITFDALMKRFGVGVPSTNPPDTNSPPFNILDYAHTAQQVTLMAGQLDALLKDASGTVDAPALDKRIAQLDALATRARDNARSLLNHAFLLAAGLILLCFVCALLYRRLARKT